MKQPCSAKALHGGELLRQVGGVSLSALCLCAFAPMNLSSYHLNSLCPGLCGRISHVYLNLRQSRLGWRNAYQFLVCTGLILFRHGKESDT